MAGVDITTFPFGEGHGTLADRGRADSYYRRSRNPHYGGVGGDSGPRVEVSDVISVAEYNRGFDQNEAEFFHKEWN